MGGEFVLPCGEAAELLAASEQVFDEMAGFVAMLIILAPMGSIRARRDVGGGPRGFDLLHQRIGIVAFVGDDRLRDRNRIEQGGGVGGIRLLGACQGEGQGIAQRIGDHVDLRAPAAARAAQCLRTVFF